MQPAPDLRKRNLGAIFDVILDTDRDGIIAAGDFEQLAQGVCDQLGVPDGPKAAAIPARTGRGGSSSAAPVTAAARSPALSSPRRT
jgi:hypothetical protein